MRESREWCLNVLYYMGVQMLKSCGVFARQLPQKPISTISLRRGSSHLYLFKSLVLILCSKDQVTLIEGKHLIEAP